MGDTPIFHLEMDILWSVLYPVSRLSYNYMCMVHPDFIWPMEKDICQTFNIFNPNNILNNNISPPN